MGYTSGKRKISSSSKFIKIMKFYENLFIAENRKALGGVAAIAARIGN